MKKSDKRNFKEKKDYESGEEEMHQSLFIFLQDSEYVIYGDNKQRSLDQQAQQMISNDTNRSPVFDCFL